jgi:hypothetical protein
MAGTEPTVSGLFGSLKEKATGSIKEGTDSLKGSLTGHFGKIGEEVKGLGIIPSSLTRKNNDTVEEVKPAAAPAAGGRRRSRRKNKKGKKSKKRKTSRRGRKSKKRVRFSKRK